MLLKNFALASILLISLYFFDRDLDNLIYFDRKMKEYVCICLIDHCWMYLVTALVPSETACLANSPGRMSFTAD